MSLLKEDDSDRGIDAHDAEDIPRLRKDDGLVADVVMEDSVTDSPSPPAIPPEEPVLTK